MGTGLKPFRLLVRVKVRLECRTNIVMDEDEDEMYSRRGKIKIDCDFTSTKFTPTALFLGCFYRLVGLVVKASASRAEDPGFESRLRRDFFGVESYQ